MQEEQVEKLRAQLDKYKKQYTFFKVGQICLIINFIVFLSLGKTLVAIATLFALGIAFATSLFMSQSAMTLEVYDSLKAEIEDLKSK